MKKEPSILVALLVYVACGLMQLVGHDPCDRAYSLLDMLIMIPGERQMIPPNEIA